MILLKIDPNLVRPGWVALFIVIALAVVLAMLIWSMGRRMRKIRLPRAGEDDRMNAAIPSESDKEQPADPSSGNEAADPEAPAGGSAQAGAPTASAEE